MTQYRPSDRPLAIEVLKHPWFQRCPSSIAADGPAENEEAQADLDTLESLGLDSETVDLD